MKRATGIGGIFFHGKDPSRLRAWYQTHLGIDLTALLRALRGEGCQVLGKTDGSEYGKFGWVIDPEGNKVELWQPPPGQ